jgi:hypothetical protein
MVGREEGLAAGREGLEGGREHRCSVLLISCSFGRERGIIGVRFW